MRRPVNGRRCLFHPERLTPGPGWMRHEKNAAGIDPESIPDAARRMR